MDDNLNVQDLDLLKLYSIKESRAHLLLPFAQEVLTYTFEDIPDYDKLIHLLQKMLLDKYEMPLAH